MRTPEASLEGLMPKPSDLNKHKLPRTTMKSSHYIIGIIAFSSLTSLSAQETKSDQQVSISKNTSESSAEEEEFAQLEYKDKFGSPRTLIKAKIRRVEPDGIVFSHDSGVSKVPFASLPEAFREKHGFNPEKAKEFAKQQAASESAYFDQVDKVKAAQKAVMEKNAREARLEDEAKKDAAAQARRVRAEQARQQIQAAEAARGRDAAIRAMQRAIRTGDRTDEARAIKMLTTDAPEALQGFNDYLAAKAAQRAAAERSRTEQEIQRLQSEVNRMRDKIETGF
jgi:hypothetical protein